MEKEYSKWEKEISREIEGLVNQYCSLNEIYPNQVRERLRLVINQDDNSRSWYDIDKLILKVTYDIANLTANIEPIYINELTAELREAVL